MFNSEFSYLLLFLCQSKYFRIEPGIFIDAMRIIFVKKISYYAKAYVRINLFIISACCQQNEPFVSAKELIIIPRSVLHRILTSIHLQLFHPSAPDENCDERIRLCFGYGQSH